MIKHAFLIGLFFANTDIYSQRSLSAPNMANTAATGSPSANAFNRQNQVPVNYYTGIPQIDVPIFSYNGPNLQTSIGLSYFAGGVKLEETAGNTGFGWSLSAGGAVTRTVQGLPDDHPTFGWIYTPAISFTGVQNFSTRISSMTTPNRDHYYEDNIDAQWDIFQFSAGSISGKFYLGKDGSVAVSPMQKTRVQYQLNPSLNVTAAVGGGVIQGSTIESFTITDDEGVRYIFNEREVTVVNNSGASSGFYGKAHVSAWYLSSIISPFNEDTISFTYQNTMVNRAVKFPESYMNCLDCPGSTGDQLNNASFGTSVTAGKRIKTIQLPDRSWIDFVYDAAQRCDLPGEHALREINVRDTELRSGYKLDYAYFTQYGEMAYNSTCSNHKQDYRLQLKAVTPYTPLSNNPPYVFHYEQSNNLPSVNSPAQDHWGNYNGAVTNAHLVPSGGVPNPANRNANGLFATAAVLKALQNPAGGSTVMEYEPHQRFMPIRTEMEAFVGMSNPASQQQTFRKVAEIYPTRLNYRLATTAGQAWNSYSLCNINIIITPRQGTTVIGTAINRNFPMEMVVNGFFEDANFPIQTDNLLITWTSTCQVNDRFSVSIRWENETGMDTGPASFSGGVRLKTIAEYDGINAKPLSIREFRYQLANGQSSGFINSLPHYSTDMRLEEVIDANGSLSSNNFRVTNAGPVNFQHYTQGSPVGYSRVEEFYGTVQNNIGRTVYEFTTYDPESFTGALNQNQFPQITEQVQDWMLGLPLRQQQYDAENVLKSETINHYVNKTSVGHHTNSYLAWKFGVSVERYPFSGTTPSRMFTQRTFRPRIGMAELVQTTEIDYEQTEETLDSTQTITTYEYDPINYVPVKTITSSNRKRNQVIETNTWYPFHYTGITTGPIQTLKTAGILTPIATETWIKDVDGTRLMDVDITEFQIVNGNQVRPFRQLALEAAAPVPLATIGAFNPALLNRNTTFIKPVSEQTVFNPKGLSLESRNLITGEYNSIITDFDAMLPVAKIANARHIETAYSSFESAGTGGWTYSGLPLADPVRSFMGRMFYPLTAGNITKSNIPAGKTYILSCWTRSGAINIPAATTVKNETNSSIGWTYNEYRVNGGTAITISGTANIDELRLYPVEASMVTENFRPLLGVLSACDANNKAAFNEYDSLNRLRLQRDQDHNIIKAWQYRFAASTTIDRTPIWQDEVPLTLQCEKHGATQYNTGNQLKLQKDINPASFTSQAHRWVSLGANTMACPITPDWQDNGVTECVLNASGVRTGEQRKQQRDNNPVSPTFNQLRWVSLGVNGNCPVVSIRASIETRNVQLFSFAGGAYEYTNADVFIVLRDAATNLPVNGNNLQVNYRRRINNNGNIQTSNLTATLNNVSEILIYSGIIEEEDSGIDGPPYFYFLFHTMLAGSGYVL
jgi:hypothetical protein